MSAVAAVRVLPPSRPEARTWLAATARREGVEQGEDRVRRTGSGRAGPDPAGPGRPGPGRPVAGRVDAGRVTMTGRAWGARVGDDLPDAVRWAAWFAVAVGEAVLGRRPATQLVGWTSPEVQAGLARRQRLRGAGSAAPRTVLLSGRVQHPAPQVAEASAVLRAGARLLVLAFRLEGAEDRWVCTALDAGFTPDRRRPRPDATPGGTGAA